MKIIANPNRKVFVVQSRLFVREIGDAKHREVGGLQRNSFTHCEYYNKNIIKGGNFERHFMNATLTFYVNLSVNQKEKKNNYDNYYNRT